MTLTVRGARADGAAEEHAEARLSPIAHNTLYERAYEELRNAIMDGVFEAGDTLTIRGIAEQLGTSAMPVREALRRLATEGALEVLPNRSIHIPEMDLARVEEVCRLRILLEGEAVALAARRITPGELDAVRLQHREFVAGVRAGLASRLLRAGQRFHFAIYDAARAPTTLSMIGMLWLQSGPWLAGPVRRALNKRAVRTLTEAVSAHHEALLEALEAGDGERAAAALRSELEGDLSYLRGAAAELGRQAPQERGAA